MNERDVLRRAKEVLLERGWRNDGCYGPDSGDGPVCVMGALGVVIDDDAFALAATRPAMECPAANRLAALCPAEAHNHSGPSEWTILNFNDERASFEEVIDLLDSAIAQLEPSKTPELVA